MSLPAAVVETSGVRRGLLGLAALAVALTSVVNATDYAVFGPETFRRETSTPVTVRRTFVVRKAVPPAILRVANNGVSSGEIAINGEVVVGPSDFSQDAGVVPLIQRGITLRDGSNEIAVELRSAPGSSITVSITNSDALPPAITATLTPAPNGNGWNKTPVTVHFTCSDGESGIASCPADQVLSNDGAGQTVSGTAVDNAGNATTVTSPPVNIDQVAPSVLLTLTPSPNENGWHGGPVTGTFTCVDAGSGIDNCPSDQVASTDGVHTLGGTATDRAGNTAPVTSEAIRIDLGNPTITATMTPPPNAAGWNNTAVTVRFTCADTGAGIADCPSDRTITTEGADQSVTGTALDRSGNSAVVFAKVNIDLTSPTLALASPADNGTVRTPTVAVAGTVDDGLSGVAGVTCNGLPAAVSGAVVGCSVPLERGPNTILAAAVDVAGNTTTVTRGTTYARVPVITFTSPEPSSYLNISPTTVSGSVDDPTAIVTINSVPAGTANGAFTIALPLAEGPNIITATATSPEGAVGTASITATLDTTPPHVTITSPPDKFVTAESAISVAGIINDLVVGTVNDEQARVKVNGSAAQVANRTFLAANVPLEFGTNVIEAEGTDRVGNFVTTHITIVRRAATQPKIRPRFGDGQSAGIGSSVEPLVVELTDELDRPKPNQKVVFKVTQNDGIVTSGADSGPSVVVLTDEFGLARANWKLGFRAGAGSNAVEAYCLGFEGRALFTATGTQGAAGKIVVDTGNDQIGVIGEPLPRPLIAVVVDKGNNRLGGVPVTFSAIQGGGKFDGQDTVIVTTDPDGRAQATLKLGQQEGNANNFVQATFPGNTGPAASFTASGRAPGNPDETRITGVVLDNSNVPIPGVTVRAVLTNVLHSNVAAVQTAPSAQTDIHGQFAVIGAPVGFVKLIVDGSTVQLPGSYPSLEYDLVTVAGQNNTVGQPMYLLPINTANQICVSATKGGKLEMPEEAPGFSLTVAPGQVTFPGGSKTGCVSVTVVNGDKVPMVPGFGQQPRFIVTIQPAGAVFNPPAAITLPNVDGLAPREVTEMYSFDHDIGSFVAIGTGVVSDDGRLIRSSPGVGVLKAGWHCGGNPATTGAAANCPACQTCVTDHCEADPSKNGQEVPTDKCQICKDGAPTPIDLNKIGLELAYTFAPPAPAVAEINKALEKLKTIGIIASVNLLQVTGKISEKECCDSSTGKGKGTEVSGSVTGDFGGFTVKGKVWPPGPIPFIKITIDVDGLASLEAKGEFVGGVFIGLAGKVTGELGYRKKDCSKDAADQAGCIFGKLEIGLTPSITAEIGGSASLTFDCFFCDKTTISVAASFMAGDLSWPISIAGVQYNVPACSTGLTGGFLNFGDGKFKVSVKFSGSWKTTLTGTRKVDFTVTFVDCTINSSGVSCSFPF